MGTAQNTAQAGMPQQPMAVPNMPMPAMPYLRLSITGSDGAKPEASVMSPITIAIPRELSLRLAGMHVLEYVGRELKRLGLKDALKAIGLK